MIRLQWNLRRMQWLFAFQEGGFSTWIRESDWALFAALIVHTISMGLLLGTAAAVDLRVLGVAAEAPLSRLSGFAPVLRWSAAVAITSGMMLVAGYPAKAALNPLFYIKLLLLIAAYAVTRALWRRGLATLLYDQVRAPESLRKLAVVSLMLMAAALTAGKFLAHTAKVVLLQ